MHYNLTPCPLCGCQCCGSVVAVRFFTKIDYNGPNGCWLWKSSRDGKGYGRFGLGGVGGTRLAHRVSYEFFNGPIPKGMEVCHSCDVPTCVNPEHLFLGTHQVNMRDMWDKARARPGDWQGRQRNARGQFI